MKGQISTNQSLLGFLMTMPWWCQWCAREIPREWMWHHFTGFFQSHYTNLLIMVVTYCWCPRFLLTKIHEVERIFPFQSSFEKPSSAM